VAGCGAFFYELEQIAGCFPIQICCLLTFTLSEHTLNKAGLDLAKHYFQLKNFKFKVTFEVNQLQFGLDG